MRKINNGKRTAIVIYLLIFLLLLLCNCNTHYLVDDYQYMLSFATSERITNVWQIIPSMAAHMQTMNGRLIPHMFAQLFLMIPKIFFNFANSLMFALLVYLICRIGRGAQRNNYIAVGVFCSLWVYTPAFGQVYLWLDGACNYLWSVVFGLTFLLPYADSFIHDRQLKGVLRWLFPILAFMAGACSENASAAIIGMAGLIQLLEVILQRKKLDIYKVLCMVTAFCGYVSIYLAPAQWMNKSVVLTKEILIKNINAAVSMYASFSVLLCVFAVLLVINIISKADYKRIWLSIVLIAGSLCANFIMVVAVTYPERSAVSVCVFTIAAIAVLASNLQGKYKTVCAAFTAWIMVLASFQIFYGAADILSTHNQIMANEAHIIACAQQGIMDVEIPNLASSTKYSALYAQRYITGDPTTWPNWQMADYYGVNNIYGK